MADGPLVSCLCSSRPERWGQLQRAILDFQRQTYPRRELVIVVGDQNDYASLVQDFVSQRVDGEGVVKVFARGVYQPSEGLLYALCQARGDFITVWDDDNLNQPERLEVQVDRQLRFPDALTAFAGSLYYFHDSNEVFVVHCEVPGAPAAERVVPSTVMGPRDVFPCPEGHFRLSPAVEILSGPHTIGQRPRLVALGDLTYHHMVGVTHNNLRGHEAHRKLAQSRGRTAEWLRRHEPDVRAALDHYLWDAATVTVSGVDAVAFTHETSGRWPDGLYPVNLQADDSVEIVQEV
jgi:glycosyltransferase involved in cell wall biosynthesis